MGLKQIVIDQITSEELKEIVAEAIRTELKNLTKVIPKSDEDIYGTRSEVAKKLHISLPTLNELTKKGILKGYRLQGRVLYKWIEIDGALQEIASIKYKRTQ